MRPDGLLAEPRQPARHHAGDRHPGRRRHRRDREHRAPHARWASRPIAPRSRRPTRSGWRSSRPPLTIMAVFAPVSFMGGIAGQYFKQFGLTVAVAVFFSLLVARLITPMMAAYLLRGHGHAEPKPGLVMRGYLRLLTVTLRFRWLTLAGRHRRSSPARSSHRLAADGLHSQGRRQPHRVLARTAAGQPAGGHPAHHRRRHPADP